MGQQSLKIKNKDNILHKVKSELLKASEKKYLKDHFLLGDCVDIDKVKHNMLIQYALHKPNCEVIDWIWYKINGKLDTKKYCEWELKKEEIKIKDSCLKHKIKECLSYTNS